MNTATSLLSLADMAEQRRRILSGERKLRPRLEQFHNDCTVRASSLEAMLELAFEADHDEDGVMSERDRQALARVAEIVRNPAALVGQSPRMSLERFNELWESFSWQSKGISADGKRHIWVGDGEHKGQRRVQISEPGSRARGKTVASGAGGGPTEKPASVKKAAPAKPAKAKKPTIEEAHAEVMRLRATAPTVEQLTGLADYLGKLTKPELAGLGKRLSGAGHKSRDAKLEMVGKIKKLALAASVTPHSRIRAMLADRGGATPERLAKAHESIEAMPIPDLRKLRQYLGDTRAGTFSGHVARKVEAELLLSGDSDAIGKAYRAAHRGKKDTTTEMQDTAKVDAEIAAYEARVKEAKEEKATAEAVKPVVTTTSTAPEPPKPTYPDPVAQSRHDAVKAKAGASWSDRKVRELAHFAASTPDPQQAAEWAHQAGILDRPELELSQTTEGTRQVKASGADGWYRGLLGAAYGNQSGEKVDGPKLATPPSDPKEFGRQAQSIADNMKTGAFGNNKVFINHAYEEAKKKFPDMTLGDFKDRLVAANAAGTIRLGRADLVEAMRPEDVAASETKHLGANFHFIQVEPGERKQRRVELSSPKKSVAPTDPRHLLPHQRTLAQHLDVVARGAPKDVRADAANEHRRKVELAHAGGDTLSPEILADYPHLTSQTIDEGKTPEKPAVPEAKVPEAEMKAQPQYKQARIQDIESPAQGNLASARLRKPALWKKVVDLRQRIKNMPLKGNDIGLRLELIKAENAHRDTMNQERDALRAIESRANELGMTTLKLAPAKHAEQFREGRSCRLRGVSILVDQVIAARERCRIMSGERKIRTKLNGVR